MGSLETGKSKVSWIGRAITRIFIFGTEPPEISFRIGHIQPCLRGLGMELADDCRWGVDKVHL